MTFKFLQQYITSEGAPKNPNKKYRLFKLKESDVLESENKLGAKFPKELRKFYLDIGYGFLNDGGKGFFNRILDPQSLVDFRLGLGDFEGDPISEDYRETNCFPFFENSEVCYLTIKTDEGKSDGTAPIYYFNEK